MVTQRIPPARNLGAAIEASEALAGLLAGHRRSRDCFDHLLPVLPANLRALVRPGPVDGACLNLFVEHNAAAAKLRQLLPHLLEAVRAHEPAISELKLKIVPRSAGPSHSPR